ncbi:MAG: hypothetical protein WBB85_08325, partial [Albidovulum sp.]|uniref:hypothetical protein n=1 Tax=Albidovulum sp. TaxID=1872424 RepID=UPI003CBF7423
MNRSATRAARFDAGGGAIPSTEDMLFGGSFQARLAQARLQRERVLSGLGGEEVPLRRHKPWEATGAGTVAADRSGRPAPLILTPKDLYRGTDAAAHDVPANAPRPLLPDPQLVHEPKEYERHGKKGLLLLVVGLVAGIVIGAGVPALIPPGPHETPGSDPDFAATPQAGPVIVPDALPEAVMPLTESRPDAPSSTAVSLLPPRVDLSEPSPLRTPAFAAPAGLPVAEGDVFSITNPLPDLTRPDFISLDILIPPQAVPPPVPPLADPQTVFLHVPSSVPETEVQNVFAALKVAGFTVEDPRRVGFSISTSNVRYFHDADAGAATRLAETIGAAARDFTAYRPSPPDGTIEVWIAGRASRSSGVAPDSDRAE